MKRRAALFIVVLLIVGAFVRLDSAHSQNLAQATPAPTEKMDAEASRVDGGIQQKAADHPRNLLVVEMRNLDRYIVHVKLHSKQRGGWQWPNTKEVFTLKDSQFHTMRVTCNPGEKICYGAARSGNYAKYWGVGIHGKHGCKSCCMECGGSYRYTLTPGS